MSNWNLLNLAQFVIWCQQNPWEGEADAIGWLFEQVLMPELSGGFERMMEYGNIN